MYRLTFPIVLLTGLVVASLSAQEGQKGDPKKGEPGKTKESGPGKSAAAPEGTPGDCEIHFLNGSKVRLIVQSEKIDINTIYGSLSVPIQDVLSIEFGVHFPEGHVAKIDSAIKNLGSTDFRVRELGAKNLVDLGPYSYGAVLHAGRAKDAEVAGRAKEIAQKLQAKYSKKDLRTTTDDKVVTPSQTIVGRIVTTTVKTKAEYFGEVDHKLAHMRSLRAIMAPGLDVELSLDAGKYAMNGQWHESGYVADGRSTFTVSAKGMIDQWPQGAGQYMCGPNGMQGGGRFPGGGGGGGMAMKGQRIAGPITSNIYGGMLIGKIGEDGEPFVIGDRHDVKGESEGKLYLHIGPSPWGGPSAGAYEVKITRKTD